MSRGGGLARTLQIPAEGSLRVCAVPPSGDCFYEAMGILLPLPELDRPTCLATPQAMRELVANRMTQELFELYSMYAMAGVEDFAWMHHHRAPRDLEGLRAYAKRSGKAEGAGQCLWADEHALQTIASEARVTLLIVDEQATSSRGSRSGRRRGANDQGPDGRFLAIGHHSACVILHRSRRQHYNAVIINDMPVIQFTDLPVTTRALWPSQNFADALRVVDRATGAPADATRSDLPTIDLTDDTHTTAAVPAAGQGAAARRGEELRHPAKKPKVHAS